jgi:tRNA dimethylallyltransferase
MNFLVVIGGPTAAGKTALAIRVAQRFGASVFSADSRQFYREMSIGTAKPSREQLDSVKHHFIDSISIEEEYDTGRFEKEALERLDAAFKDNPVQVMTGGSGLFIEAVIRGLDELPGKDPDIRKELQERMDAEGISALQEELRRIDPEGAAAIDIQNPHRLIRALELCRVTGQPLGSLRKGTPAPRNFTPILVAVTPEREELYRRIDNRVLRMMENGLLDEVKGLFEKRHLPALRTVGYTELFDYLEGKTTLEEAVQKIQQHTRNYAKRQLTWFRNREEYAWFDPDDTERVSSYVSNRISGL